jgi:DNA-binding SARP family transcriptional activator
VSDFRLRLFGAPALVTAEGGPAAPSPGAKPIALLAYLTLEARPHTRESLAALLWGESPETEARASLRQALKHLRETLGDVVHADRAAIELNPPVPCDVLEFRAAVEVDPARAAGFDVPRFFEGVSLRRAPQFEEWVAATRASLLRQYHQLLAGSCREAMRQCHWRESVDLADRWLASEPLSDDAAYLAVEARYLAGSRSAALSRYAEYREFLAREASREPGRNLQALARRVEADRGAEPAPPITDEWYANAPSFEASLVEREVQWKALTGAWKSALRGKGRIVLVEGESGVGKSRLTDEFLRWVVAEGGTTLRGRCYDRRAGVPYEPLVEAVRCALDAPGLAGTSAEWLAEVARLVPELRERFPGLPAGREAVAAEGWRLFEGVAQLLAALAAERPVAIAVDDLQWCDEDTCNLIRFLIRRLEQAPVLWIGLITLGEVEREAPASRLCRVLRAKSQAELVTVGPLDEDGVWHLVREMARVSVPNGGRRLAARLFRISAGNPFYVIELLKTMFAQGLFALDEGTGEWTVVPEEVGTGREVPVSQTVQDVIAERVDRLPAELRDLLITIAVSGSGCRTDVLSHVHGISRLHAAGIGDALIERHLVVEDGGAYRCLHPVIAHLVRDGLTSSRRQEVHRALALALERVVTPEDMPHAAGAVARHAERGLERDMAYRYARIASESAVTRYAYAEALSWLDLAAASARGAEQVATVDRLTADVLERAGWSEAPSRAAPPVTREIASADLDLRVKPTTR